MTAAFMLASILIGASPKITPPTPKQSVPKASAPARITPPAPRVSASDDTKCAACHQDKGWHRVTFAHDRTGFALRDAHTRVDCRSCHLSDFTSPIARNCSGCHRDPHTAEFGQVCESCHQETGWQPRFSVDAHRGTLFPLSGAHATLPCQECHTQMRDRVFAKTATTCTTCHMKDYVAAAANSIDHSAAGFSDQCQTCHSTARFSPARLSAHEACFVLSGTVHAAIGCRQCHTQLTGATISGACNTGSAACTACHSHGSERTAQIHAQVPGYQYKDGKCYECHRFSRTGR